MSTCDARRPTLAPLLIETLATLYSETREYLLGGDEANYLEHVLSRENLPIAYGAETAHRGKQRACNDERPEWLHDTLLPRFNSSATGVAMSRTVVKRRRVPRSLGQGYPQPEEVALVNLCLPSQQEVPGRPVLLWRDGYRPSDIGYARWAEIMWERIEPSLAAC